MLSVLVEYAVEENQTHVGCKVAVGHHFLSITLTADGCTGASTLLWVIIHLQIRSEGVEAVGASVTVTFI